MSILNDIDKYSFKEMQEMQVAPGTEHICQGFHRCEDKKLDNKDEKCKECLDDVDQAIRSVNEEISRDSGISWEDKNNSELSRE